MSDIFFNLAEQSVRNHRRHLRCISALSLVAALIFIPLHFLAWKTPGAGIACALYVPVCILVIWGSRGSGAWLNLHANIFIFATLLLTLTLIVFQRREIVFDAWILTCPVMAFVLCKRQVAAIWGVITLLAFLAVQQVAQHPSTPASSLSLALEVVGASIGLYLYSRHIEKNEHLIITLGNMDSLTNTLNRRSFHDVLQTEFRRNLRQQVSMAAFMVDADHFKAYNDHYGHISGDRVLVRIAEALRQSARRPGDFVFRYGGEEFCVLCSGVDAGQAAALAEALRVNIEALALEHQASPIGRITVSVGYRHAELLSRLTPEQLIDEADKALYTAKANGRNRVERYNPDPVSGATA